MKLYYSPTAGGAAAGRAECCAGRRGGDANLLQFSKRYQQRDPRRHRHVHRPSARPLHQFRQHRVSRHRQRTSRGLCCGSHRPLDALSGRRSDDVNPWRQRRVPKLARRSLDQRQQHRLYRPRLGRAAGDLCVLPTGPPAGSARPVQSGRGPEHRDSGRQRLVYAVLARRPHTHSSRSYDQRQQRRVLGGGGEQPGRHLCLVVRRAATHRRHVDAASRQFVFVHHLRVPAGAQRRERGLHRPKRQRALRRIPATACRSSENHRRQQHGGAEARRVVLLVR